MSIRIGKKPLSLGHEDRKEKEHECKTDASASAIVSRKGLKDAFAARNPQIDRTKLDEAVDSFLDDEKETCYADGFKECLGLAAMSYGRMTGHSRDDFMNTFLHIIKENEGHGLSAWLDLYYRICKKAWDEGAIHGFGMTGEGFNAEYPYDGGDYESFDDVATDGNPYDRTAKR